jgi:hypothetical protein
MPSGAKADNLGTPTFDDDFEHRRAAGRYVRGDARDLADVPKVLIERLEHHFATYKRVPASR